MHAVAAAVTAAILLTQVEFPARYFALGNDPINGVHLNIPSIDAPVMPGQLTTVRTATYIGSGRQQITVSATTKARPVCTCTAGPQRSLPP